MSTTRRVPPGFALIPAGRLRLLVRDGAPEVADLLRRWARNDLPPARALPGGRGGVGAFLLRHDLPVVLRPYRRGGLIGRVNRSRYLGFAARPFRELRTAVAVAAAGVPTPEPLGAAVLWDAPGVYRGAFATRELWGAANLWRFLQQAPAAQRGDACGAAAALVRRLHDAGALHPDLNLQNFLIRRGAGGLEAWLIDLDGVRFTTVTPHHRQAAFARICRSIRRLDPESAVVTLGCVEAFRSVVCDS
jgi:3-deoxy-D-manno-octulosonic acid kinase